MRQGGLQEPVLEVTPADALIDQPRRIVVHGLRAGEHVTLTAQTTRGRGVVWPARRSSPPTATAPSTWGATRRCRQLRRRGTDGPAVVAVPARRTQP